MANLQDHRTIQALRGERQRVVAKYDFEKDGGATGTYGVFTAAAACVIYNVYAHSKATFTGASAEIELGDTASDDVFVSSSGVASWASGNLIQPVTGVLPRKLAEGDQITFKVQTAALTAGKADIIIDYANF